MPEGNPFDQRPVTDEQVLEMQRIRDAMHRAYTMIVDNAVNCRERSLALTKLEEASMWANKAITHGKETVPHAG
jgi:hypothetical protein